MHSGKRIRKHKKKTAGKGLVVRHSFAVSTTVYRSGKEKSPLVSLDFNGDYKFPALKLAAVLVGGISAGILIGLLIKKLTEKVRRSGVGSKVPAPAEMEE